MTSSDFISNQLLQNLNFFRLIPPQICDTPQEETGLLFTGTTQMVQELELECITEKWVFFFKETIDTVHCKKYQQMFYELKFVL